MAIEPFINVSLTPYSRGPRLYVKGTIHYGIVEPALGSFERKGELFLEEIEYASTRGELYNRQASAILLAYAVALSAHVHPAPLVGYPDVKYADTPADPDQ